MGWVRWHGRRQGETRRCAAAVPTCRRCSDGAACPPAQGVPPSLEPPPRQAAPQQSHQAVYRVCVAAAQALCLPPAGPFYAQPRRGCLCHAAACCDGCCYRCWIRCCWYDVVLLQPPLAVPQQQAPSIGRHGLSAAGTAQGSSDAGRQGSRRQPAAARHGTAGAAGARTHAAQRQAAQPAGLPCQPPPLPPSPGKCHRFEGWPGRSRWAGPTAAGCHLATSRPASAAARAPPRARPPPWCGPAAASPPAPPPRLSLQGREEKGDEITP